MKTIRSGESSYPVVEITETLQRALGCSIDVDLDSLNQLLRVDVGLQYQGSPLLRLYGKSRLDATSLLHSQKYQVGLIHLPSQLITDTSSVVDLERDSRRTLVHAGSHMVDFRDHSRRSKAEFLLDEAANAASLIGSAILASAVPGQLSIPVLAGGTYAGVKTYTEFVDPAEYRARQLYMDEALVDKYPSLITITPN